MPTTDFKPDDFDIQYKSSKIDDNITLVTSTHDVETLLSQYDTKDLQTLVSYRTKTDKEQWSVVTNESSSKDTPTLSSIDNLAQGIHFDLIKLLESNRLVLKYVDSDGYMGYVFITGGSDTHSVNLLGGGIAFADKLSDIKDLTERLVKAKPDDYRVTDGIDVYDAYGGKL